MAVDPSLLRVQSSTNSEASFSPDHFAGTLVRAGLPASTALRATATVHGLLLGSGTQLVTTDALRAASGEILAQPELPDVTALRRVLLSPGKSGELLTTSFAQVDIRLDGRPSERSDWGWVKVHYLSSGRISYFNMALDGRWIFRNAPLFPADQSGFLDVVFYFDLGVKPGVTMKNIHVATSMSSSMTAIAPSNYALAPVEQATIVQYTNFSDEPFPPVSSPPGPYEGGSFPQVFYCRLDYPNQPCGKNECGPAAVSNSLKWLKKKYSLTIDPPEKLTIDYWKTALGWDGTGVTHGAWADAKKKFVDDKNNNIPIDSDKQSGGHAAEVLKEFNGDNKSKTPQAVEVDIGSHIASVTCMGGPDSNGNYHLIAASDTAQKGQNGPGQPSFEQIEISPNGEVLSGPGWAKGQKVNNFVVQCPHPGKFS